MKETNINARKIALNGILGALALVCLFLATVLPTSRLALYALSSFFVSVSIIESGVRAGWLFYASTALLGLILLPDKLGVLPYVIFFGFYGIAKFYIEKLKKLLPEYILKFVYFNICLAAAWFFIRQIFIAEITVKLPWYAVIAGLEAVFLVYDFVYTMFIAYYRDKLKKLLRI